MLSDGLPILGQKKGESAVRLIRLSIW